MCPQLLHEGLMPLSSHSSQEMGCHVFIMFQLCSMPFLVGEVSNQTLEIIPLLVTNHSAPGYFEPITTSC